MAPQDSFIDEEDDTCPLCVEEFDLSDKSFRPCPCGYQVCQFCFNNIKNNMNGLCPACRRPYSEETMVFKVVTPEEVAKFKADVQKNAKKKAEQRQKEAQKREVESLNRKHLAGLRVIQKNLVYVLGLSPGIREDEMLQTLRGEKYFGQYGKIIKIVVQKAKQGETAQNGQSIGVYVTFDRKEDAARCIAAVNGSQNGDRVLRAQLGTTKYCSAYLRNETCTNKQCMFLHEPGDNDDSYSRQDLSSINSVNTQRPLTTMPSSSRSSSRQAAQFQAPLQQAQPVAAASQPMARGNSKEGSDSGDGSALPSSASWANQIPQQRSRRGSHVTSGATSSPAVSNVLPFTTEVVEEPQKPSEDQQEPQDDVAASSEPTSTASPEPDRNSTLQELLKAINSPLVTFPKIGTKDLDPDFPPLFDDRGGEKRRAIREQEEARLHLEQESQADMQSVEEPVEEEEQQMSGSLQLGGEPEDNHGREGSQVSGFNNSRRLSTQLPIQRASNGAPFGASLGQIQNHGNPTINGRTLTPQQQQQLQLLKSGQSPHGFADQLPHGAGQNSALFQQQQGQGHNRQSSRYNFVTESSSTSSSVKPLANPKMMAQQAAMMPSGNYAQSNNQFYGTSMQGPPPGLKSTGTPPIGGMFGQGRGFGGSIGGSSVFGGSQTDSNSDMLRDMLRGRGGISVGSSQVHDTGKREYMFPSFLQQYPPASSTPAPAPGLLASLYGHQPGAFHDFGPKQKKKGKKHRHANTSSSGGGGLVDLADPSILQARMQHQQQSNAGVGQGLFGGQAQEDQLLPSLGEMELAVDQVVAENSFDDVVPPTFDLFSRISRSSTPSVPPGFGPPGLTLPHGHPSPVARESSISKPSSRIAPNAPPFTPKASSAFLPRASTPLSTVSVPPTPTQQVATPKIFETSPSQAKENVKVLATNSGLSKAIASQASASVGTPQPTTLQSEDFPALEKGTAKQISSSKAATPVKGNSTKKVPTGPSSSTSTAQPVAKSIESRSTPGILNISVPLKGSTKVNAPETLAKSIVSQAAFPALPPSTPVAAQVNAPRPPKTLRVVPTPKNEVPPGSATPSSTTSMFPPLFPSSRQPSLASASRLDRPGTPTSEIISETASITSASLSRASSPPPSKVGSAPVRTTTKSMQKKQRREAQREKEKSELESVVAKPEPEVEIAPIMGRKKKQRKEKPISSATGGSPQIASRAPSPTLVETTKDVEVVVAQPSQATEKQASTEQDTNRPSGKINETKGKGKVKVQRAMSPEPVSMVAEVEEEPVETPNPTPSSVFQELLSEGLIPEVSKLNFVKTPVTFNAHRHESTVDMQDIDQKLIITKEDRSELLSGKPVHKIQDGASRLMLTPNGECIRNLSPEEEERYLNLQARIASDIGPTTFLCEKHNANNGFQLIKGRAVPNGPPAFFPLNNNNGTPIDPVSKIQRDEALSYINQYVLPSLAENPQLEHALNANSLDADLNRGPHDHSSWSSWRTDVEFPHSESGESPYGPSSQEGILATGLENMTHHFAVGREVDRTQQIGNVSLLSLENADAALQKARKETEGIEKTLNRLVKKNRKLLMVTGH